MSATDPVTREEDERVLRWLRGSSARIGCGAGRFRSDTAAALLRVALSAAIVDAPGSATSDRQDTPR